MILGIDLGTTFSLAAYTNAGGTPVLCPSQHDSKRFQTPSVVHIGSRGCLVGDLVEQLLEDEPALPVSRFAKLSMGKPGMIYSDHEAFGYPPEAISAMVLRKVKADAEMCLNEPITGTVITVPAHFNDAQREATVNAGRLADLPVLQLIEEPVAAATYFGLRVQSGEKTIFVFDMGGGTLDATILHATPKGLYVIATEGATNIGGKNFDEILMKLVWEQDQAINRRDLSKDPEAIQRCRAFSTAMKLGLSEPGRGILSKPIMLGGKSLRITVNRDYFETAAEPWLEASKLVCQDVLKGAGMAWEDIDDLVLTGGSSLVPCVQKMVREMSGLPASRISLDQPHASVAYGAALLAEQLHGERQTMAPPLKQLVTSNELGIKAYDPESGKVIFHPMIEKNVPLPTSHKQTVYTQKDDQKNVSIEILQRKDAYSSTESLGKFQFGPIMKPEKNYPVEITMGYDESGRVLLTARDIRSGQSMEEIIGSEKESSLMSLHGRINSMVVHG